MSLSCPKSRARQGFTLVELLVVIAIIGVLVALLLPAVQQAREAARRMQCGNNMKQMGLAIHNYHDTYLVFPPGHVQSGEVFFGNWCIGILPYIEQQALYDSFDHSLNCNTEINAAVGRTDVKAFACPSDSRSQMILRPASGVTFDLHASSYKAMGGLSDNGARNWDHLTEIGGMSQKWRGIFHTVGTHGNLRQGFERMASILDGTSNTLMVGEYHQPQDVPSRGTFWAHSMWGYNIGMAIMEPSIFGLEYNVCSANASNVGVCRRAWGSRHPGGMNFLRADASSRFMPDTIDLTIFCAMSTMANGEPISQD